MNKNSTNIFSVLKAYDDSGDEATTTKNTGNKSEPVAAKESKDLSKRPGKHPKEAKKIHAAPAEPHPLDRRSGTGRGKEIPKKGAGRHNYGTYKTDLIQNDTRAKGDVADEKPVDEIANNENPEGTTGEEKKAEDTGPKTINLSEYYQKNNIEKQTIQEKETLAKNAAELQKHVGKGESVFIKKNYSQTQPSKTKNPDQLYSKVGGKHEDLYENLGEQQTENKYQKKDKRENDRKNDKRPDNRGGQKPRENRSQNQEFKIDENSFPALNIQIRTEQFL